MQTTRNIRRRRLWPFWKMFFFAGALLNGAGGVELNNWRLPYYRIASEMELASSSPSGMFWDDLVASSLFDSSMIPDSGAFARNHWTLEPAYALALQTPAPAAGRPLFWHFEVLNDIRYRNILARQTLAADRRYDNDPYYPAHPDRFARGRIEEAYLEADWRYGFIRFGRLARTWGPFVDRSLLLSSNPYTYDALEWQVHGPLFEFRQLFAAFVKNDHGAFDGSADNLTGRFLAAHALNVMIKKWVTLGIVETMLFHRENGFPDFQYVNPFDIYSVSNTNQEGSGNLMLGFQWNVHPGIENLSLRGQLLLDDIQVDRKTATDKEPSHWGLDAGVYWRDALPLAQHNLVKAGYRRSSEWIYTVSDNDLADGQGYTYLSKGIGAPRNDGDSAWVGFSVVGKNHWAATAALGYGRQGSNTVNSAWKDSDTAAHHQGLPYDYASTAFPSGIVEKTFSFSLTGMAYWKDFVDLQFNINNRWIRNKDHLSSSGAVYSPVVSLALGVHFSDFWVMLPD
jgi:hypothetical protein